MLRLKPYEKQPNELEHHLQMYNDYSIVQLMTQTNDYINTTML